MTKLFLFPPARSFSTYFQLYLNAHPNIQIYCEPRLDNLVNAALNNKNTKLERPLLFFNRSIVGHLLKIKNKKQFYVELNKMLEQKFGIVKEQNPSIVVFGIKDVVQWPYMSQNYINSYHVFEELKNVDNTWKGLITLKIYPEEQLYEIINFHKKNFSEGFNFIIELYEDFIKQIIEKKKEYNNDLLVIISDEIYERQLNTIKDIIKQLNLPNKTLYNNYLSENQVYSILNTSFYGMDIVIDKSKSDNLVDHHKHLRMPIVKLDFDRIRKSVIDEFGEYPFKEQNKKVKPLIDKLLNIL